MQYPTKIYGEKMTGQLEEASYSSSSFIVNHSSTITSKMSQSSLRRSQPFKMSAAVIFVTAYIISALVLPGVVAIKCYECNSKLDPRCGEPFDNFTIALVDCEQQRDNDIPHLGDEELAMYNRPVDEEGNPVEDGDGEVEKAVSFCRKTMQTIDDKYSVVRSCGWIKNFGTLRDRTCFSRTGTHQIQMQHCVCGGRDGCNGAKQSTFSFVLLLLPLLPAYIFHISN